MWRAAAIGTAMRKLILLERMFHPDLSDGICAVLYPALSMHVCIAYSAGIHLV
jgi:hypothetical protein